MTYENHIPNNLKVKMQDNWKNKNSEMVCDLCFFYVNFRCRRNAPTIKGFPAVYPTDWCGEHKLGKEIMQKIWDGKNTCD